MAAPKDNKNPEKKAKDITMEYPDREITMDDVHNDDLVFR